MDDGPWSPCWPRTAIRYTTGIVNADGTGYAVMELPNVTVNLEGFTWGPGGVVGFAGENDVDPSQDGIYVGDPTDPATIRQITTAPDGVIDYPLVFSPDGSRVAYLRGWTGRTPHCSSWASTDSTRSS